MTMAKIENGNVTEVGLPDGLRGTPLKQLAKQGWVTIVGPTPPAVQPDAGYMWFYGEPWTVEDGNVVGVWTQQRLTQPYPSWSFVDGEGWVAPTPAPEGDYVWDESQYQDTGDGWVQELE